MAIHFSRDELTGRIFRAKGPAAFIRVPPKDVHPLESDNVMLEDIYACEADRTIDMKLLAERKREMMKEAA